MKSEAREACDALVARGIGCSGAHARINLPEGRRGPEDDEGERHERDGDGRARGVRQLLSQTASPLSQGKSATQTTGLAITGRSRTRSHVRSSTSGLVASAQPNTIQIAMQTVKKR